VKFRIDFVIVVVADKNTIVKLWEAENACHRELLKFQSIN